ncbi:MAG: transposase [Pleurocapsa sp.]
MNDYPAKHHRKSIRLKGYDYSQAGYYFVTICCDRRQCLFGDILNGAMQLNQYGEIVAETYQWLSQRYPYLILDEWIIMPNHFHGIMIIADTFRRGGSRIAPTIETASTLTRKDVILTDKNLPINPELKRKSLGRLIGAFKTVSTKKINLISNTPGKKVWQRNYYEHIIRNEKALNNIRQYIINNPLSWHKDQLHPNNPSKW